jgi:hypothetical protein
MPYQRVSLHRTTMKVTTRSPLGSATLSDITCGQGPVALLEEIVSKANRTIALPSDTCISPTLTMASWPARPRLPGEVVSEIWLNNGTSDIPNIRRQALVEHRSVDRSSTSTGRY